MQCARSWELAKLHQDALASLSLSFGLTRLDSNSRVYDVNMVPMPSSSCKSRTVLQLYGQTLAAATAANGGCPPLAGAWDGGLPNCLIQQAFLGIADPQDLRKASFFNQCYFAPPAIDVPFFGYKLLMYGDFAMFGNNDSLHVQKRVSVHCMGATRKIQFGDCRVCLTDLLRI